MREFRLRFTGEAVSAAEMVLEADGGRFFRIRMEEISRIGLRYAGLSDVVFPVFDRRGGGYFVSDIEEDLLLCDCAGLRAEVTGYAEPCFAGPDALPDNPGIVPEDVREWLFVTRAAPGGRLDAVLRFALRGGEACVVFGGVQCLEMPRPGVPAEIRAEDIRSRQLEDIAYSVSAGGSFRFLCREVRYPASGRDAAAREG